MDRITIKEYLQQPQTNGARTMLSYLQLIETMKPPICCCRYDQTVPVIGPHHSRMEDLIDRWESEKSFKTTINNLLMMGTYSVSLLASNSMFSYYPAAFPSIRTTNAMSTTTIDRVFEYSVWLANN